MTSLEQAKLQVVRDLITLAQRDAVAMRVLAEAQAAVTVALE
jgi:hypothetical protein